MERSRYPPEHILQQTITVIKEPVLFQQILQDTKGEYGWKLFEWNVTELIEKFGDIKLPFRVGYNARSEGPQWEINCSTISMTLSDFIQSTKETHGGNKKWYYFDYKYMHEWFKDKSEIMKSVNWRRFGIDKDGSDSTLWIGSKGAHTCCHQDSYGCNLVAQIHGRKEWLLFPPSSSNFLQPARIPYEESTVYSKYNFFCPTKEEQIQISNGQEKARVVTLEPGDVLYVPPGWWHYVESLDFTVSVNIWLPIPTDNISRLKEAIVKLIVSRIGTSVSNLSEAECTLSYCMNLLNIALKEYKNSMETMEIPCKKLKPDICSAKDLATEYPLCVNLLHELKTTELQELLRMKAERFSEDYTELLKANASIHNTDVQNSYSSTQQLSENIVNALCHPDVINKVTELLLL